MVKGRRAADRRRERQGPRPDDDGRGLTMPGIPPLATGVDYALHDEPGAAPAPVAERREGAEGSDSAAELPWASQVQSGSGSGPVRRDDRDVTDDAANLRGIHRDPLGPDAGFHSPHTGSGRRVRSREAPDDDDERDPEASFAAALSHGEPARQEEAEVTSVKAAPERAPARGGRLVVLEGPGAGREFSIELTPSLIGRAQGAEILLPEPSVSRVHCEIFLEEEGWTLADLESASGTLVNGEVVEGDAPLLHGDVIQVGKVMLRFLRAAREPAPRPEPEPEVAQLVEPSSLVARIELSMTRRLPPTVIKAAPPPPPPDPSVVRARVRRSATSVIVVSLTLLAVFAVGSVIWSSFVSDRAPAQIRTQVAELLADGNRRIQAQDVDGALANAQTVLALDPSNEAAQSLLKMATTEGDAREAMTRALRLADEDRVFEAEQVLKRVADTSVFASARDRLRRTVEDRELMRSRRRLETLADEADAAEVKAAVAKHLERWPDDAVARALLSGVQAAPGGTGNPELDAARAAFRAGDIAGARARASAAGLRAYLSDLEAFESALALGRASLQRFDASAVGNFEAAQRLLGALGGDASSPIAAQLRKAHGSALYLAATDKLERDPCAAARELFRAARTSRDDPKIQQALRDLDARALAALERARAARLEDPDRASRIARDHLCLVQSGSPTWEGLRSIARL